MNKRGSGVLLHVTSLPSPFGVGDFGPSAYRFADFLHETRQAYWQVLPLSPTSPVCGNSPYSSVSTFAGNTLLVSPELLVRDGLISQEEADSGPSFPDGRCDYDGAILYKERLLDRAHDVFFGSDRNRDGFHRFCEDHATWLDTYALFTAIKKHLGGTSWGEWPRELRDMEAAPIGRVREEYALDIEREKFAQFLFFSQWQALKGYCNDRGIRIIGDIPIYVSYDSADVWADADLFKLDADKKPTAVSGVPPDYFSASGQLWGNPVYNWDTHRLTGYEWWIKRLSCMFELFDTVRIDHFRGLVAYWEVPAHETTAINGHWVGVPADDFFNTLLERFPDLPIIAEDLGLITPDVRDVIGRFGFPGMKVLLFAFGEDNPMHIYLPHTYERNYVVYTGTHDNDTVRGWFEHDAGPEEKRRLFRYLGKEATPDEVSLDFARLAMMSIADTAILPMQDVLGLGREAQMNRPSVSHGNWEWRLLPSQLTESAARQLRTMTETYGRA